MNHLNANRPLALALRNKFLLCTIAAIAISCKTEHIEISEPDLTTLANTPSEDQVLILDEGDTTAPAASMERTLRKYFKACLKADDPLRYVFVNEPSRVLHLGSLYNVTSGDPTYSPSDGGFTDAELFSLADTTATWDATCTFTSSIDLDLDFIFKGSIRFGNHFGIDSLDIGAALRNYNRSAVVPGPHKTFLLREDALRQFIETHPSVAAYKRTALENDRLIILKIYYVKGFTTRIETGSDFSIGVQAALPIDSAVNVIVNGNVGLKLQRKSTRTIEASSTAVVPIFFKAWKVLEN